MGSRGPVPKRSDQRRRRNKPRRPLVKPPASTASCDLAEHSPLSDPPGPRPPDPAWHPVVVQWYESLSRSGQTSFYEPSDWATAFLLAELMSRDLNPHPVFDAEGVQVGETTRPVAARTLVSWLRVMAGLLVTTDDRRRFRVELKSAPPDLDLVGTSAGHCRDLVAVDHLNPTPEGEP